MPDICVDSELRYPRERCPSQLLWQEGEIDFEGVPVWRQLAMNLMIKGYTNQKKNQKKIMLRGSVMRMCI